MEMVHCTHMPMCLCSLMCTRKREADHAIIKISCSEEIVWVAVYWDGIQDYECMMGFVTVREREWMSSDFCNGNWFNFSNKCCLISDYSMMP